MKKTLAIFVLSVGLLPAVSSAGLIRIQGESRLPGAYSSWEVVGHNTNGNGYLQTFEVTQFSGITVLGHHFSDLTRFVFNLENDSLRRMRVADANGNLLSLLPRSFQVSVEQGAVGVPEPSPLVLIGLGLLGLALSRRRRPAPPAGS
jgi:hypothetical protein